MAEIIRLVQPRHKVCVELGCERPSRQKLSLTDFDTGADAGCKFFCDEHAPEGAEPLYTRATG